MNTLSLPVVKSQTGFTLLELLVALAIVGLLSMISYPIYNQHVLKARRANAEIALLHLASALEHYHGIKNTYVNANFAELQVNEYTDGDAYRLQMDNLAEDSYLIKALPQAAQQQDKLCGVLSLDNLGQKEIMGTGKIKDCW